MNSKNFSPADHTANFIWHRNEQEGFQQLASALAVNLDFKFTAVDLFENVKKKCSLIGPVPFQSLVELFSTVLGVIDLKGAMVAIIPRRPLLRLFRRDRPLRRAE